MGVNYGVEKCRKVLNCVENRFHPKSLAGHTSAGTGFPKITERQAKACRHRPTPLNCEGPSGVFRIVEVIRYSVALRNSARNRFPLTVTLINWPSVRTLRMQAFLKGSS